MADGNPFGLILVLIVTQQTNIIGEVSLQWLKDTQLLHCDELCNIHCGNCRWINCTVSNDAKNGLKQASSRVSLGYKSRCLQVKFSFLQKNRNWTSTGGYLDQEFLGCSEIQFLYQGD